MRTFAHNLTEHEPGLLLVYLQPGPHIMIPFQRLATA